MLWVKISKIGIPPKSQFYHIKVGYTGVFICFPHLTIWYMITQAFNTV